MNIFAVNIFSKLNLNWQNFLDSFEYMGKGMLCIFIVILVIMASVYIMGAVNNKTAKKKEDNE